MRSNDLELDCLMERLVEVSLLDEAFAIGPDGGSSYEVEVPPHVVRGAWSIDLDVAAVKGFAATGICSTTFPMDATLTGDPFRYEDVIVASGGTITAECGPIGEGQRTASLNGLGIAQGQVVLTGVQVQLVDPAWAFDDGEDAESA